MAILRNKVVKPSVWETLGKNFFTIIALILAEQHLKFLQEKSEINSIVYILEFLKLLFFIKSPFFAETEFL